MCFSKRYIWIEAEKWPVGSWDCKDVEAKKYTNR